MNKIVSQKELDALLNEHLASESNEHGGPVVSGRFLDSGIFCLYIDGRALGLHESDFVFGKVCSMLAEAHQHAIINLKKCPYFSSFAIGEIARLAIERQRYGHHLVFVEAGEIIRDVIALTSLDQLLKVCNSIEDAEELLLNGSAQPPA
ncbi:MAG: hypothetical protein GF398_06020 [Chitinivibrionales bacterium]|nr:hypothetical protein [Chitinivibrionales bacterium]